jgi:two-component system LytT family sensor kinase
MLPTNPFSTLWIRGYFLILGWFTACLMVSQLTDYWLLQKGGQVLVYGGFAVAFIAAWIALLWGWASWLLRFHRLLQVLGNLLSWVMSFLLVSLLLVGIGRWRGDSVVKVSWQEYFLESLSRDFFDISNAFAATIFVFYLIVYIENLRQQEHEKAQLQVQNQYMQLALLKSQLNPHFLFNTLNSVNTLMQSDITKARRMNVQLAHLLRYALEAQSKSWVTLQEELAFIDAYLEIQKVRFEERLRVIQQIQPQCLPTLVPPMLLHPLVENAIKHGLAPKEEGGTLWLTIEAKEAGVWIEVADNGLGQSAPESLDEFSAGIGLRNTNSRLQQLYNASASLQIESNEGGFRVRFVIPSLVKGE